MNKFFFFLDRYKYGVLAVLLTSIIAFMYLQLSYYTKTKDIDFWEPRLSILDDSKELEIQPEDIQIQGSPIEDLKSLTRDINDDREQSKSNWTEDKPMSTNSKDILKTVKELEKQYFEETGGQAKREKIIQEKQARLNQKTKDNTNSKNELNAKTGGDKSYAGNVMVEWVLSGRNPHQNNNYYVRNPGYTCGEGSAGFVVVKIKVDQGGTVLAANTTNSSSANPCMLEQARRYALMSRFAYSKDAPVYQEGTIKYIFVSQ
jgi:hypothetical protein